MTLRLRLLVLVALVLVLAFLVYRVKNYRLDLKYTLSWFLLDIGLIILVIFPGLLESTARALGIYSPVNMIFFFGFIFSLVIIYTLTVAISQMTEQIKKMAQTIAVLQDRVKKNEKKIEKATAQSVDSQKESVAMQSEQN